MSSLPSSPFHSTVTLTTDLRSEDVHANSAQVDLANEALVEAAALLADDVDDRVHGHKVGHVTDIRGHLAIHNLLCGI